MKVTKVRFYDIADKEGIYLAKCSIVLDNLLILKNIKIMMGKKGKYLLMPEVVKNGKVTGEDVFHPINSEFFKDMTNAVFRVYDEALDNNFSKLVYDFK